MLKRLLNVGVLHVRNFSDVAVRHEKCMNSVTLLGRTGSGAQLRGSERHPVVTFSLATNTYVPPGPSAAAADWSSGDNSGADSRTHADADTGRSITHWHRVSVFKPALRQLLLSALTKGQRVLVNGSLSYYQVPVGDAGRDGNSTTTVTSIIANEVIFFSGRSVPSGAENAELLD